VPIRLRLAVLFALGTAALIIISGFVFSDQLEDGLRSSLDATLRPSAELVARSVTAGFVSSSANGSPSPVAGSLTQVYDASGALVGASVDAGRQPILTAVEINAAQQAAISVTRKLAEEGDRALAGTILRVRAMPVARPEGTWVVAVGRSDETVENAVDRVHHAIEFGGPPVVVLAGLAAWLVAGSALRPVERMRREVAVISEHGADASIVVPKTRDEIAKLAATMNDVLIRLKGALDRERQFVTDAGHELRTPLTILQGELELARRKGRSREELVAAVDAASFEVRRLAALAEDLLALGRHRAASSRVEAVTVAAVVQDSVTAFAPRARDAGIVVRCESDHTAVLDGEAAQLRRAVDNLLDNASRFAPLGSEILASVRRNDLTVIIEIADEGPGFPVAFLPHAFERFRRADDARSRNDGGAGLGLALVRQVALAHGGDARAANRQSGGASVIIELPRRPPHEV
jgi:two-component system, OmpR family, sensor kinase